MESYEQIDPRLQPGGARRVTIANPASSATKVSIIVSAAAYRALLLHRDGRLLHSASRAAGRGK